MDFAGLYQVDHRKKKGKSVIFFKKYFLPFFLIFLVAFFIQLILRVLLIFPAKINTNAMEPELKKGGRVFLVYSHLATISKENIIHAQLGNMEIFCKVAGMEGDIVQIINKSLFINHNLVKDYSKISKDKTIFPAEVSPRDNTGEFSIGPRHYFCLNDNWENIQDSRSVGTISFDEIKGKVFYKNLLGFK